MDEMCIVPDGDINFALSVVKILCHFDLSTV